MALISSKYEKTRIVVLQDILVSMLASLLSILLVRWVSEPIPGFTVVVLKWLGGALVGMVLGITLSGSYKDVRRFATVRSMGKTILAVIVKEMVLVLVLLLSLVKLSPAHSVMVVSVDLLFSGAILVYIRITARMLAREKPDIKDLASRKSALVVGTDMASLTLAENLEKNGFSVVGLITGDRKMSGRVISDYVVYACNSNEELARLQWQLGGIDSVFFPRRDGGPIPGVTEEDSVPQNDGMSIAGHAVKRCFDIGCSGLLLLIFSPVIALCAVFVKREDGGPVIFSQERIGRGGKPFNIYKFRSMRIDAEGAGTPALYSGEEDPRLTKVGRFLRAHHLDELPQLWNVLRGDMSFIGYRPERQYYIDRIMACNARYRYLFQIRPGVTSYATLYNGYTDTLEKMLTRLDLDLYYLRNHTVWFDIKVLGLTFLSIISGKKF